MLTRRIGTFGVLTVLAAAGSALLVAQAPQQVSTWASAGVFQNPYGDGPSVALADGRTLIVGGATSDGLPTEVVAIFDSTTNVLTTAGALLTPRTGHTATLQKDGRVLVTGGLNGSLVSADVEVFDPVSGTSTLVTTLPEPRTGHSAARLNDGRIVIVGGRAADGTVLRTALIYDPETNAIAPVTGELQVARAFASATTLLDGRVIIIGGTDGTTDLKSAETFYPVTESFSPVATQLTAPAHGHTAVMLPNNGSVLIVGGTSDGAPQQGADLFLPAEFPDPFSYGDGRFAPTAPLSVARSNVIAGPTPTEGYAFAAGGGSSDFEQYRFATIKTDKDDYAPGQHAIITGTGWQPGEQVRLLFQEDPAVHDDYVLTLTADGQGNIYTDQWAPEQHDLNVRFYLTASDSKSKAQTTFTDGNLSSAITFTIGPGSVTPGATLTWSVAAVCQDGGGPNTCASEGYTHNGPVQNGYEVIIQQATNSGFTQNLQSRATTTTTSGAASGTLTAPASGGPYFYRARHNNQNLTNVPTQGNDPNSWQPKDSAFVTVTLVTDTTPPVIAPVITGTLGNNGWYTSNVDVTWDVIDGESTITSPACTSATVSSDTPGQTFNCSATSAGGTASSSVTIKRDASAPSAPSFTRTPSPNASGWNTTDVSVSFTNAGDNGPSGIASCTSTVLLMAETSGTTVDGSCTDNAGNVGPVTSVAVKIDKTGPVNVVGAPARPADHNGWFTAPVDIVFSGQDAFSGVASCTTVHFSGPDGGSIQVNGICTDVAGNASVSAAYFVNYDATAPTISGSRTPGANAFGWNNSDVTVSFSCSDATSGLATGYPPADAVLSAEGAGQSVPGTCVDNAGNSASATVSDINIDKTAPIDVVGAAARPADHNGWFTAPVNITFSGSDALSGIASCTTVPFSGPDGADVQVPGSCSDVAGNQSANEVFVVNYDATAPSISGSRTPGANALGWNNTDVTVSFTCSDATSGLAAGSPPVDTVLSAEGAGQSAAGTCVDNAGHSATATVGEINIDKTSPIFLTVERTPDANGNGWNNSDVTAHYTANDVLSGLDSLSPANGNFIFNTDGANQSHTFTVTDKAGNSSIATISGVNVDKTAPVISGGRLPGANGNGWNNTNVNASYTASDATSGLDANSPAAGSHLFANEGAGQSKTFTVTDLAGNTATVTISNVNIDKTAPTISALRTPGANAHGWNNTDVVGSYNASDSLSGLESPATGSVTFSDEGAGQFHVFTVSDLAGNSTSATVNGVNIDKTAPVVGVTGVSHNAVYTLGAVPSAGCNTSDPLSGVLASAALSTSGAVPPGVGTITASCAGATDKAGNAALTTSVTFTVQFAADGVLCNGAPGRQMLQPINFTGSSVFPKKGGSTIPAKFRVCGADGVSIGPTPVVKSFVLHGFLNGTTVDVNEAAVEATNSDTAFRWSSSDAQWIFNISTKELTAGKTYVYRVYLNDGTYIQFQFGIK